MSSDGRVALVLGAGIGGLCAAARLAHAGYRTVLVEALDRVGGRASSEEIDGFTVNTGAIAIEFGGAMEETFATLDAPFNIRVPEPASAFRIGGKTVDLSRGGWGLLIGGLLKHAAPLLNGMARARDGELPEARVSTKAWLARYTGNATVHAIFRNLCAAIFSANSDELPANVFLAYFMTKGAFKRFGFCPGGTLELARALAAVVARNGEVWLSSPVERLLIADGRAVGAVVHHSGERVTVAADVVVSNLGPERTLALADADAFPADYRARVGATLRPTANIVVNFASREPLLAEPGIVTFGRTRRLCNMANLTATCPEVAPPGWHLYVAYGVPIPAIGSFDSAAETDLTLNDLRDELPGFEQARILSIRVMRDQWPAQRSCAGFDLPPSTPVPNLWHVGDAVKPDATGGTQACAETARRVVEAIGAPAGAIAATHR